MKMILLAVLFCLYGNFAFAENPNVAGEWLIDQTCDPFNVHRVIVCGDDTWEWYEGGFEPYVEGMSNYFDVSQTVDGTLSSSVEYGTLTQTLNGEINGQNITFTTTSLAESYFDNVYDTQYLVENFTGVLTNGTISGIFNGTYFQSQTDNSCTQTVTGQFSGTFTIKENRNARLYPIEFPDADYWTPRGILGNPIVAESGERLEVHWVGGWLPGQEDLHYELRYYRPGDRPEGWRIGQCHFFEGANSAFFFSPDRNENTIPDYFASIHWISRDFGNDDNHDGLLDVIQHSYDVGSNKYSRLRSKFDYACGPPVSVEPDLYTPLCSPPYGQLRSLEVIDPPLGSETEELFDSLLLEVPEFPMEEIVMGCSSIRLCDMDSDGNCNSIDLQIVKDAVGKCWGESGYYPLADIDGDGCVSDSDVVLIFGIGYPDLNYDKIVNFADFATFAVKWLDSNCEPSNIWCDAADLDTSGRVDILDVIVFAEYWLEGK